MAGTFPHRPEHYLLRLLTFNDVRYQLATLTSRINRLPLIKNEELKSHRNTTNHIIHLNSYDFLRLIEAQFRSFKISGRLSLDSR